VRLKNITYPWKTIFEHYYAHIDVEAGEIRFNINGKEERFAFKPKASQCSMTSIVKNAEEMAQSSLGHSPEEN
jgi:hypothetical protein